MRSSLRHFLPFGLVRALQLRAELVRIGINRSQATKLALRPATRTELAHHNFDLLPDNGLAAPECVIDIGTNLGDWTNALLALCRPNRVLCVEPDPQLAVKLRARFQSHPSVEICETAIGDKSGIAGFNLMESHVLNSLRAPTKSMDQLFPEAFRVRETIQVKIQPLDALTENIAHINLLKIDAQGFEREIIAGAKASLAKTDIVLLEINFQPHYEGEAGLFELDASMQQNGFCIGNYSSPKGGERQALFADFLYVRKKNKPFA